MKRSQAAPLSIILVIPALSFAGCVGSQGSDPLDATAAATGALASGSPLGALGAGAKETAATVWVRDYWADQSELLVADAEVRADAVLSAADTCTVGCGGAGVPFGEGRIIPPGTSHLEFSASFVAPPTAPGVRLLVYYGTSADGPAGDADLSSGETVSIPVSPDNADAPFQKASLWWFWVLPRADPAGSASDLEIAVKIVAKRGAALPSFPEAPDYWGKAVRKPLVAGPDRANTLLYVMGDWWYCYPCEGNGWSAHKGGLVPAGSQRIEATITWDWPGPAKPVLNYWYADGVGALTLAKDGETQRTYEIAVSEGQVDSPYQARSLWGFWTDWESNGVDTALVNGKMTLQAEVVRAPDVA